jgi:hypothetical protein
MVSPPVALKLTVTDGELMEAVAVLAPMLDPIVQMADAVPVAPVVAIVLVFNAGLLDLAETNWARILDPAGPENEPPPEVTLKVTWTPETPLPY